MSNFWGYDLLGEPSSLTGDSVRSAFEVLTLHGFGLFDRRATFIHGTSVDGLQDLTFEEPDEAVSWLGEQGGLLSIWHLGKPEFNATISHADVWKAMGRSAAEKPLRRLGLGLTAGYFRPPSPREEIADIMRRAFVDLISAEAPPFANVYDEEIAESVDQVLVEFEKHLIAVADRRPSPMVSWLNYFSPSYATALGTERLRRIEGLTEEAGGYVWQLTEYPWELTRPRLDAARRRWTSIFDV